MVPAYLTKLTKLHLFNARIDTDFRIHVVTYRARNKIGLKSMISSVYIHYNIIYLLVNRTRSIDMHTGYIYTFTKI